MIWGVQSSWSTIPDHAYLYANGVTTDISPFDNPQSYAHGINNHGQVVGDYLIADQTAISQLHVHRGNIRKSVITNSPETAPFVTSTEEPGEWITGTMSTRALLAISALRQIRTASLSYGMGTLTDLNTLFRIDSELQLA